MKKIHKNVDVNIQNKKEYQDYFYIDENTLYNILCNIRYTTMKNVINRMIKNCPKRLIDLDKNIRNRIYENLNKEFN